MKMGKAKIGIDKNLNAEIGKWLHKLRHDCRMGVEEVARALNASVKDVEDWESGSKAPTLSDLLILLRLFQVDSDLVGAKLSLVYLNHSARLLAKNNS